MGWEVRNAILHALTDIGVGVLELGRERLGGRLLLLGRRCRVRLRIFDTDGGAVVNSSRGLLYAYTLSKKNACKPEKFATATRNEIIQMNESIAGVLAKN